MKKIFILLFAFCSVHFSVKAQYGEHDTAKTVPPFKIFDNLYYVGIDWVSSYLLTTDDGLILIDALYGKYPKHILQSVRDLGFDPKQIKYILCTHGHYDHCEGADTLKQVTHARIGMTELDWQMAEGTLKADYTSVNSHPARDWVIHDGDSLKLGNTVLKFYTTPGHTPGVLSMYFPVREGNNTYKAFIFGGVGFNFNGVQRTEMYIQSVDRLMKIKDIQVNISNHPNTGKIFERAALLKTRKPGEVNPFVAPNDFTNWLKDLRVQAEKKLAEEKAGAAN
ncbi:MAG: MBL fold metallo-hydrolase [Bacteroidota bacterium]